MSIITDGFGSRNLITEGFGTRVITFFVYTAQGEIRVFSIEVEHRLIKQSEGRNISGFYFQRGSGAVYKKPKIKETKYTKTAKTTHKTQKARHLPKSKKR